MSDQSREEKLAILHEGLARCEREAADLRAAIRDLEGSGEEERFELLEWAKAYAGCHVASHTTTSKLARLTAIAIAALEYGDTYHTHDAHCCAGDHDNCTAREALEKLEALVGGPGVL